MDKKIRTILLNGDDPVWRPGGRTGQIIFTNELFTAMIGRTFVITGIGLTEDGKPYVETIELPTAIRETNNPGDAPPLDLDLGGRLVTEGGKVTNA